jgi:RimJ/RimL family protein N-acetyltransferase
MSLTDMPTLRGSCVDLEPLAPRHAQDLTHAVQDGALWNLWYTDVPRPEAMEAEIDRRLALHRAGSMMPFALVAQGRAVGMTTYMNIDAATPRVEIGSTWLAAGHQRSGINREAKRMLLAHAFDVMRCPAVEFRTHALNQQSRRAIEGLGARLDGILRSHRHTRDGALRDTCVYSIVASEWPAVRLHLERRLA